MRLDPAELKSMMPDVRGEESDGLQCVCGAAYRVPEDAKSKLSLRQLREEAAHPDPRLPPIRLNRGKIHLAGGKNFSGNTARNPDAQRSLHKADQERTSHPAQRRDRQTLLQISLHDAQRAGFRPGQMLEHHIAAVSISILAKERAILAFISRTASG
jgi:hypothetical protein